VITLKRRQKLVFCSLLVLTMVLAVTAVSAAPAQSFDDLLAEYGLDPSDPDVQSHVLKIGQNVRVLDVELSIEGLYYDGECMMIGWKTNNLRPEQLAMVLYTNVRLGGISADADADFPVSRWWPQAFGLCIPGDPLNGLTDAFFREDAQEYALRGTQEVTVDFTVKRPHQPIAVVDDDIYTFCNDADLKADLENMLAAMDASNVTVAPEGDTDVKAWQDQGYLVVNCGGETLNADGTTNDMSILNGEDLINAESVVDADEADVSFTFTVDYDTLI
jgi:hypothetical protein